MPRPRRRSAHRLYEGLQELGYGGAYDSVQRFVKRWKASHHGPKLTEAFSPVGVRAGRCLPIRLEPRAGGVGRRAANDQGGPFSAGLQPPDVRRRVPA